MSINLIILVVIGFVAMAFLYDAAKKSRTDQEKRRSGQPQAERMLTANEAGPTETGRYRVQEALRDTEDSSGPREAPTEAVRENPESQSEEEELLPDPFGDKYTEPKS